MALIELWPECAEFMLRNSKPRDLWLLLTIIVIPTWLVLSKMRHGLSRPRRIPNVYVAGTDGGKRSLTDARKHFVHNCGEMILEGLRYLPRANSIPYSHQTQGGFFYLPTPAGDRLLIPTKYMEELKNAPDEQADFTGSFLEMFSGRYTTVGVKWHLHPGVVKTSLNANLASIMPAMEDEINHAFETLLPKCQDWTPIRVADTFTAIISRASNRMLGGTDLSRNDEWTATSIDFTADTWAASQRLKQLPAFLRPLAQYWLPEMARVRRHGAVARRMIVPLMERRLEKGEAPLDLLQMLWDGAEGADKTPEFMAYTALAISFAAIRTSSSVPTHLIYDLCARPEYVEPLRAEIEQVLDEEGGRFTKAGLARMEKLDSFMKESQRFNPLSFLTFGRLIHKDLTLHDGTTIPAGTMIGIPAYAISHDPRLYPAPGTFDGFRFVGSGSGMQFVTTNAANLSWGYGKHACSGRFFAASEIKMIVAHFLRHYDFRFAGARATAGRPPNVAFELQSMADPTVEVEVRRRRRVGATQRT